MDCFGVSLLAMAKDVIAFCNDVTMVNVKIFLPKKEKPAQLRARKSIKANFYG